MKTLQLQRKILNGIGKKNPDRYFYSETKDENLVGITDSYVVWILEREEILINLERLQVTSLNDLLDMSNKNLKLLEIKEYFRKPNDKEEYVRLQGKDEDVGSIYIRSKYLEFFEDFELYGSEPRKPVYVAEKVGTGTSGLIMPINMGGEYYD